MPMILNVDHKVLAMTTLAATASVATYSLYRLYTLKQKLTSRENVYETAKSLNEYLVFHYGSPDEILPWSFGPKSDVDFPKRCADLCVKHAHVKSDKPQRALDIGCGVGRATFELARVFDEVVGIDYSKSFIETCCLLHDKGQLGYTALRQGDIVSELVAVVDSTIDRSKVRFQRGDACSLPLDIGQFDCVLAANLICWLHTPHAFLDRLSSLVSTGGILVITSPYTFEHQFTPRESWIGGWLTKEGNEYTGFDGLRDRLETSFELVETLDMPMLIRATEREFQWTVSHASIWCRR